VIPGAGGGRPGPDAPEGPPTEWVAGCVAAQRALDAALAGLRDEQARAPSLLEGWSVGHVLSHVARNADSVVWRLEGAACGELRDQYPGGLAQRRTDIEAGAGRPAAALAADVARTSAAVEAAMAALRPAAWDGLTRTSRGVVETARDAVFSRWREVVVHHGDLGLGRVTWPPALVTAWLPRELPRLVERTDPQQLLAWVIGRGPAPALDPW
jgi:maleylpyruvate isomerase